MIVLTFIFIIKKTGWGNIGGTILCSVLWPVVWVALGVMLLFRESESL